jgi:hypothetical protein
MVDSMKADAARPRRSSEERYQIRVGVRYGGYHSGQSRWSVACKIGEHLRPVLVDLLCRGSRSIFRENSARGTCWLFPGAHPWRLSENTVERLANEGIRRETLRLSQGDKLGFLLRLKGAVPALAFGIGIRVNPDDLREVATVAQCGLDRAQIGHEAIGRDLEALRRGRCPKAFNEGSVVAWLRRPSAKFRTSLVLRSTATKQ